MHKNEIACQHCYLHIDENKWSDKNESRRIKRSIPGQTRKDESNA
jgi:hypothetical protein